jgi:hypothetical protein
MQDNYMTDKKEKNIRSSVFDTPVCFKIRDFVYCIRSLQRHGNYVKQMKPEFLNETTSYGKPLYSNHFNL